VHLRSVHFAIIAASMALLILAFSPAPSDYSEARRDLQEIEQLSIPNMQKTMAEYIRSRLGEEGGSPANVADNLFLTAANAMQRKGSKAPTPVAFEGTEDLIVATIFAPVKSKSPFDQTSQFRTISEFKQVWNAMQTGSKWIIGNDIPIQNVYVDYPDKYPAVDGFASITHTFIEPMPVQMLTITPPKNADEAIHFRARECEPALKDVLGGKFAASCDVAYEATNIVMDGKDVMLYLPVVGGGQINFDFQGQFTQNNGWFSGPFADSFPALSRLTQGIDGLPLKQLEQFMDAQQTRDTESFETMGLKFPGELTKWAGAAVLFSLQFYLYLNVREKSSRIKSGDPGLEVAWFGIYTSRLAMVAVFVTIVMLPAASFLFVMTRVTSHASAESLAASIGACGALLLMSTLAWTSIRSHLNSGRIDKSLGKTTPNKLPEQEDRAQCKAAQTGDE
jgi:hypothetical protein